MKQQPRHQCGFTLIELLVVIAIIAILASLLLPVLSNAKEQARGVKCVSNLRQVALAVRLYSNDHEGLSPWFVSMNAGGTYGAAAAEAWRNFTALSNELDSPKLIACPSDTKTRQAQSWPELALAEYRSNAVSYFVGLDCFELVPCSLVAGDRNITGGPSGTCSSVSPAVKSEDYRTNNSAIKWLSSVHRNQGNIALNDGSVQRTRIKELQDLMASTFKSIVASEIRTASGKHPANHILPPRSP